MASCLSVPREARGEEQGPNALCILAVGKDPSPGGGAAEYGPQQAAAGEGAAGGDRHNQPGAGGVPGEGAGAGRRGNAAWPPQCWSPRRPVSCLVPGQLWRIRLWSLHTSEDDSASPVEWPLAFIMETLLPIRLLWLLSENPNSDLSKSLQLAGSETV